MPLTAKQKAWNKTKLQNRIDQVALENRGVAVTIVDPRRPVKCTCVHARKHHKWSGRCRRNCACVAGVDMARR
jgi:hypothetical protein